MLAAYASPTVILPTNTQEVPTTLILGGKRLSLSSSRTPSITLPGGGRSLTGLCVPSRQLTKKQQQPKPRRKDENKRRPFCPAGVNVGSGGGWRPRSMPEINGKIIGVGRDSTHEQPQHASQSNSSSRSTVSLPSTSTFRATAVAKTKQKKPPGNLVRADRTESRSTVASGSSASSSTTASVEGGLTNRTLKRRLKQLINTTTIPTPPTTLAFVTDSTATKQARMHRRAQIICLNTLLAHVEEQMYKRSQGGGCFAV